MGLASRQLRLRQHQDHVAEALAGAAQGAQLVDDEGIKPNPNVALRIGRAFEGHGADRHRGADRVEGGGRDANADHLPGIWGPTPARASSLKRE